jgi:hypothetical protein
VKHNSFRVRVAVTVARLVQQRFLRLYLVTLVSLWIISAPADGLSSGEVTVASGRWHSTAWRLTATDSARGRYCVSVALGGRVDASGCGSVKPGGTEALVQGVKYISTNGLDVRNGRRMPNYVAGPVVGGAARVRIKLSNGVTIVTPVLPPPRGLTHDISFFATEKPCGPVPISISARNRDGRVVAFLRVIGPSRFRRASC